MTFKTIQKTVRRQHVRLLIAGTAALFLWDPGSGRPTVHAVSNPIVDENALAGTIDSWDISGAGDPTIQGFATDISVNTGQTVNFKVKTDSTNYDIKIYRLGYYGGVGARKVATILPSAALPQSQPACATDATTGLVDCGTWGVSASWTATDAVSGIYVAKLTRADTGGSSHIVFIVRDDGRQADVVVQTSDTTWQAYNAYGGGSLYCGGPISNAGSAYASACATRSAKVSYNRPITTRGGVDARSFLFAGEYPMVRWLEANGYDVKYWAGVDTDRHGADLTGAHKPKAFFSVGHDEYWSGDQRTMIENARAAGVNLAFFSGNEMYWKTRYENSIDGTSTPYRTLVTYKETLASAKIDPAENVWTGTWRDPRFSPPADGGRPENGVTGTFWTVNSGTTAISVPAAMASLRFWQHTRVADLTSGVATLSPESLGYEWDEDLDNGARPTGLVHLSSTTLAGVDKIIDYGATTGLGTATHTLTLYRHASGALVFGAGTVQWAWGLDATHDGGSPGAHVPDQAMQQSTVNLLADMGAQPANLQIGADPARPLIATSASTDHLAPTSVITPPAGGQVQSGNSVTLTGTATENGGGVVTGVEVSVDGGATWHAAQGTTSWSFAWTPGALGSVTLRSRAVDDTANLEVAGAGINVTVVPGTCPCVSIWQPSATPIVSSVTDSNAIELGVKFKSDVDGFVIGVRFYKGSANTGTHQGSLWTLTGTRLATAVFTTETGSGWQQVNFSAPVHVTANTTYIASYHTNVGGYSADGAYFATTGVDAYPLHALPSNTSGGNGVFKYGASVFPNETFNNTNYWVDVVFAETIVDSTELEISDINVTVIDGSTAVVAWKTNKDATSRIDYSTNSALPPSPPGVTLFLTDGTFVKNHSFTLTGLTPNATYYYRLTAVDTSDEAAQVTPPSFTVPGPTLHDTASVDFLAGTHTSTYVTRTGDGEVILAPTAGSEFTGPDLPAGWIEVTWSGEGYSIIDHGVLVVDGARVASCVTDTNGACLAETQTSTPSAVYFAPHSLEFSANFSGDQSQHAGFGQTLGSSSEPWAIFSTLAGGQLYARTNPGTGSFDTPLGPGFLNAFHRYRIDWTSASVDYYVDGGLVVSHALAVGGPMRPIAASDFNPFGGAVFVDWMRMLPYAASGSFVSRVFDALAPVDWHSIQWIATVPSGTSVAIKVRTGDTQTPDGTWSAFVPVAAPGPLTLHSRYIQYQAAMTTSNPNQTPALEDVIISTSHAPVAVNDSAATNVNTAYVFPASGPGSLKYNDSDADVIDTLRVTALTAPAHGTSVLNVGGSVTYTPVTSFIGDDSFTYTISDGLMTASATVSMTVGGETHVNSDPTANPDNATMPEDSPATAINVLANDSITPDTGETLSVTAVTQGAHGGVTFTATGVSYTPAANYNGPDSFNYTISDGNGGTASAAVSVIVTSVNDDPVANPDSATVLEDSAANPIDVRSNDTIGPDTGETLSVTAVTQGAHGGVTFTATGVSYTPAGNYNGPDSFTYTIGDGNGGSAGATVSVTVTAVNDAPSFTKGPNQTVVRNAGAQSVSGWATGLSAGPADEAGQTLSFTVVSNDNPALFSALPAIAANGTLTYTPATGVSGGATLTVRINDNGGTANGGVNASATQSFTITVLHTPPIALCQNVTVTATLVGTATASVNAGSSDPEGGAVTLAQVPPGPYVPGPTSVTLNVTNQYGQTAACSATVTVTPYAIGASFGFEEASGTTVLDSSGNGNNGSFNASNGPQRTAAGRFGKGMVFDGIDDLITVADSNSLDLTSAMTLMAWVKVENQTGWRNILMKQNGSDLAYAAYANNSQTTLGQPSGYVRFGGVTRSAAAAEGALTGRWMHVAVTYGAGSLKMYINGNLQRTLALTGNIPASTGPLTLGGDLVWLDEFFSGTMDEVRIMGVALPLADIRTLMRTPVVPGALAPPTDTTNLVAAYNFDDGTASDKTGKGHTGVLNGAVTAPGMYGNALSFNGTSNYVAIADANDLDFTTGMTLEAWVRPNSLNDWRSLVLKEMPQGLVYALYASDPAHHATGFVKIAGGDRDTRAPDPLPTAAWSHVVTTYDKTAGVMRMWVDGIQRDERQVTGDITVSSGSLFIGGNQVWGEYFDGRIDNVRLYNRALNIVEIQTNQMTPVF